MRVAFIGDVALGDHPKTVGFGFRSRYPNGIPDSLRERIRPPGPDADLLIGNLEFALGFETADAQNLAQLQCRGLDVYARFLAAAGIRALNMANNHSAQAGLASFQATAAVLQAAGIHVVGTPADFTERGVIRVADQRIALLGWSDRPRQYAPEVPPYNEFSEAAYEQIRQARQRADLVIASVHWGDEFILVPSDREREIARRMIDAGASCVIGHHPHVIREIERYADGVIAYSLGNFIGDMTWDPRTRVAAWFTVELAGDRVTADTLTPAIIESDYFPRRLSERDADLLRERLASESRSDQQQVARAGYSRIAEKRRKRHVQHTAWMILRNLHRYPGGVTIDVFRSALSHRLRALLPRI